LVTIIVFTLLELQFIVAQSEGTKLPDL
jgi:hypothetical protein